MSGLVFFVIALAIAAIVYYVASVQRQRRREAAAAIARRHGLFFAPSDPYDMINTLPFELFDRGRDKAVHNVLYGTRPDGRNVRGFEYEYTTGSGKNARTYHWSCGMASTGAHWPHLTLGPESVFDRITDLITGDDIDFESDEFNKAWEVRCADRKFASALIDPEMMLFLMDKAHGSQIEVCEGWVLYVAERQTPEFLPSAIAWAQQFCERVPPVVWSLYPPVRAVDAPES